MPAPRDQPELLAALLGPYEEAEERVLLIIAAAFMRDADAPNWAVLAQARLNAVLAEIRATMAAQAEAVPDLVETALVAAHVRAIEAADADVPARRRLRLALPGDDAVRALVAEQSETLSKQLRSTHLRAVTTTRQAWAPMISRAAIDVNSGTMTRLQASQKALDGFAKSGITGFVDKSGKPRDLAAYVEGATRQAIARTATNAHNERLLERGFDEIIVSNSPDESDRCRPWEGKVLSITGATAGRKTLKQATSAGLLGFNCTHSTSLFIPGFTKVPAVTKNPQGYAERQEQRRLERSIREARRLEVIASTDEAKRKAAALIRERQAAAKAHSETTGQPRRTERERLTAPDNEGGRKAAAR